MSRNIIYINMFRSGYVIGSGLWSSTGVHDRPARSTLGGTYTEPSEALYCAHVHRIDEGRYRSRSRCSARPETAADRTPGSALQGRGAIGQMDGEGRGAHGGAKPDRKG